MKKITLILAIAVVLISCRNAADKAETYQGTTDSKQATIDSMNVVMAKQEAELAKQKSIDSMKTVMASQEKKDKPVIIQNVAAAPAERKRRGMSGAAKGALIGAGVGAVTGAVIDKKHGEGAIIGGLAGAGVGAGTGAIIDNEKKKKQN